jgi:hypothetical protein
VARRGFISPGASLRGRKETLALIVRQHPAVLTPGA